MRWQLEVEPINHNYNYIIGYYTICPKNCSSLIHFDKLAGKSGQQLGDSVEQRHPPHHVASLDVGGLVDRGLEVGGDEADGVQRCRVRHREAGPAHIRLQTRQLCSVPKQHTHNITYNITRPLLTYACRSSSSASVAKQHTHNITYNITYILHNLMYNIT